MTGGEWRVQNSLAERLQAGVVGAAAQRLCKVAFQSGFMVAAAASPESHAVGGEAKVEGGLWPVVEQRCAAR